MKGFSCMKKREKKRLIVIVDVLTVMLAVFAVVFSSSVGSRKSSSVTAAAHYIFSPMQSVFSKTGNRICGFLDALSNVYTYREENEQLKAEVDALKQDTWMAESLKQENTRLRELLNFKETVTEYDVICCEVIAKNTGNWFYTFKVDKGLDSGINKGYTVIQHRALVGKVTEVGSNWAVITSIINPENSVGALITRTQAVAVASGDLTLSENGSMKLSFIADGTSLVVGDSVETSGSGGVYPRGFLIGTVAEILTTDSQATACAVVNTEVDFKRISEVMVIKPKKV